MLAIFLRLWRARMGVDWVEAEEDLMVVGNLDRLSMTALCQNCDTREIKAQ